MCVTIEINGLLTWLQDHVGTSIDVVLSQAGKIWLEFHQWLPFHLFCFPQTYQTFVAINGKKPGKKLIFNWKLLNKTSRKKRISYKIVLTINLILLLMSLMAYNCPTIQTQIIQHHQQLHKQSSIFRPTCCSYRWRLCHYCYVLIQRLKTQKQKMW